MIAAARRAFNAVRTRFGYDAVVDNGRRRAPSARLRSEDAELPARDRDKLHTGVRDLMRQYPLAGWAVRKHLDYVSSFALQVRTQDKGLNAAVEEFVARVSQPDLCDVGGRHSLADLVRLAEAQRTIDGDLLVVRLPNGTIQLVEADRVRDPQNRDDGDRWTQGVQTDRWGRARRYAVWKRAGVRANAFEFDTYVPAESSYHHGYFHRVDQVRGVSPWAPAVRSMQDLYEGCEYALAKMKVSQIFGLLLYRGADDAPGRKITEGPDPQTGESKIVGMDFGKAPVTFDLDERDKAEFIESKSPSLEFQSWAKSVIGLSLKGIDIPFSFYDESFTNFSGSRQAWIQYGISALFKKRGNRALLDWWMRWRLALGVLDGDLPGVDVGALSWEWVGIGQPWIDPYKEVQADVVAIAAGLTSRTRRCRERGEDFFEIADEIAAENEYLEARGLPVGLAPANVQITEVAA